MSPEAYTFLLEGYLPLKDETEDAFVNRVRKYSVLAQELDLTLEKKILETLFDIKLSCSFPIHSTKEGLYLWEKAAFFGEEDKESVRGYIHLHPSWNKKKKGFFYKKEEVLSHEIIHAVRFFIERNGPFEEILAYQTSSNCWRKNIGALFFASWESVVFVAINLFSFLAVGLWLMDVPFMIYFIWLPYILIGGLFIRLIYYQMQFRRAVKNIQRRMQEPKKGLAVLVRLTTEEIELLSKNEGEDFFIYLKEKKEDFRLSWIKERYL